MKASDITGYPFKNKDKLNAISLNEMCESIESEEFTSEEIEILFEEASGESYEQKIDIIDFDTCVIEGTGKTAVFTWTPADNTLVSLQQSNGQGITNPNPSFTTSANKPRCYMGHLLTIAAHDGCILKQITISYLSSYKGNNITAGIEVSNNVVVNNEALVQRIISTDNSSKHIFFCDTDNKLDTIYIQNGMAESTQLRLNSVEITYMKPID